jgi:hypothetical protein
VKSIKQEWPLSRAAYVWGRLSVFTSSGCIVQSREVTSTPGGEAVRFLPVGPAVDNL